MCRSGGGGALLVVMIASLPNEEAVAAWCGSGETVAGGAYLIASPWTIAIVAKITRKRSVIICAEKRALSALPFCLNPSSTLIIKYGIFLEYGGI
jgi:hypothetical protein